MQKGIYLVMITGIAFGLMAYSHAFDDEYEIGDDGPAGGHIFYIDENDEHVWTYLEAAPQETEEEIAWGGYGTEVGAEGQDIGDETENTETIVNALEEEDTAAEYAHELEHRGYDDWFLPSREALAAMDENLNEEGIGDFFRDYWSSSEATRWAAHGRRFSFGRERSNAKNGESRVRAVRAF